MKKLRWVVIVSLGVLVACGSLFISQRGSSPQRVYDVPVVLPAPPSKPASTLPVLGKKPSLEDVQSLYRQGQHQLYNSALGEEYLRARELLQNAQALLDQLGDETRERVFFQRSHLFFGARHVVRGEALRGALRFSLGELRARASAPEL